MTNIFTVTFVIAYLISFTTFVIYLFIASKLTSLIPLPSPIAILPTNFATFLVGWRC